MAKVEIPRTRMAARLAPIPRVYDPELDKVKKIVKKVAAKKPRTPFNLTGRAPVDDQFDATVTFSPSYGTDAGRTYGAMLPMTPGAGSPEANKEFYVRCLITQHRVDPLLQAFRTLWKMPLDWVFVDGLGDTLYDEAISNPLYVTRVCKSPATIAVDVGFLVTITAKYLP